MKGGPSQGGGSGQGFPSWLGMANMYGGGGAYGGYGGGFMPPWQQNQQSGQGGQIGAPMVADFSHGAGLYQPNEAQPYYAGGQPPTPMQPPNPPAPPAADGTPATTAFGNPNGLLGGGGFTGVAQPYSQPGGLLNNFAGWHNRGYGVPANAAGGGAGGVMTPTGQTTGGTALGSGASQYQLPPGLMQYFSGMFGGGGYG